MARVLDHHGRETQGVEWRMLRGRRVLEVRLESQERRANTIWSE